VMICWGIWAILAAMWHTDPRSTVINHLGLIYDYWGLYFLFRILVRNLEELVGVASMTAVLFAPVALEMVSEKLTGYNMFSVLGGVPEQPAVREGHIRAQGPFQHAILAGTVGAVMFPWFVGLRLYRKKVALLGGASAVVMMLSCRSSGPIASWIAGLVALALWPWRLHMRKVRWLAVAGYVFLDLVMKAPAYYLIARIDFVGGSTGWHRAYLIESAIAHLHEWWWAGTDYTRHWMPTGVPWSPYHSDITNHYLYMGVQGGIPLMLLFLAMFGLAFSNLGAALRELQGSAFRDRFMVWNLGASLFAIAVTCLSVSYFDQSHLFLCLGLASANSRLAQLPNSADRLIVS